MDLESVWEEREEKVYPSLFGSMSRGIFPLSAETFAPFKKEALDPRWLTYGVFEYAPNAKRNSWLYVTSGHSNPWEDEPGDYSTEKPSGAGVEFVFETLEQKDWPIRVLQSVLAFDILLCGDHYEGREPLGIGDRIPVGGTLDGSETSQIRDLIIIEPPALDNELTLPSGKVKLFQVYGTTNAETDFARHQGHDSLMSKLSSSSTFPVTDLTRQSSV